jgi:predicted nucleic acid-binding protein
MRKDRTIPYHYWDTCNFLTILKKDKVHYEGCLEILKEAEDGRLKIITSTLTIAGIIKIGDNKPTPKTESEESKVIIDFFKHEYIIPVEFTRKTAEASREIAWKFGIRKGFDAMHIATAIIAKVDFFETTDDEIISKLQGQIKDPEIIFRKPGLSSKQLALEITKEANERSNDF